VLDKNRLRSAVRVDNAVFARKFVGVPCFLLEGAGDEDEFDRCVRDAGADALTTAKKEAEEADALRVAQSSGDVAAAHELTHKRDLDGLPEEARAEVQRAVKKAAGRPAGDS